MVNNMIMLNNLILNCEFFYYYNDNILDFSEW